MMGSGHRECVEKIEKISDEEAIKKQHKKRESEVVRMEKVVFKKHKAVEGAMQKQGLTRFDR